MAELSKLLTFVQKEDRDKILQHYNELLDNAEDEQTMLDSFGSPTKLAVQISRDFRQENPEGSVFAPRESTAEPEVNAEKPVIEETAPVEETVDPKAAETVAPAPETVTEPAPETEKKTNVALLVPYLIVAVALGLAAIAAITVVMLISLGLGILFGFVALKGFALVITGMTVFADILVVVGGAAVLLALAIFFIWLAVWLILAAYRAVVRGLKALGIRLCVKEVVING